MRIAYISYELAPDIPKGGIGTYTMHAASLMHGAGHTVHVFSGSLTREITETENTFTVHRVLCTDPHDFTRKVAIRFAREHRSKSFELVECPEIHGNAAMIKQQFPALPLIVRLHGPNHLVELLKKTYTPFWAKARFAAGAVMRGKFQQTRSTYHKETDPDFCLTNQADLVTAPSAAMKHWAVKHWKIKPDRIEVFANPFTAPEILTAMQVADTTKHKEILFFGRLNVLKGLVNFTKAVTKFISENRDWKVTVIGDDAAGPYGEASMRHWMRKSFGEHAVNIFFFDGMPKEMLYEKLTGAEIVVLPSLFETFSYTCAEAMAAGKAVVGSNRGGMKDLLGNSNAGICVNPYVPNEIYKAIKLVAGDDLKRIQYAANAKKKMTGSFYNKSLLPQMTAAYESVLKPNRA